MVRGFLHRITRAQFEANIALKLRDPLFTADISPLLAAGHTCDVQDAAPVVSSHLIELLPGDPLERRRWQHVTVRNGQLIAIPFN